MQHRILVLLIVMIFMTLNISGQSNRVGIGTQNPFAKLHIESPLNIDPLRVRVNGITTIYAHANQNVAVGAVVPLEKLHVRGNVLMDGNLSDINLSLFASSTNSSRLRLFESGEFGFEFEYDGSPDKLYLHSKGFNGNEGIRMTWLKDGKVGIGTVSPLERLHVAGNILSTGDFIQVKDGNQGLSLAPNAAGGYVKIDVGGTGHAGDHIVLGEVDGGTPNNVGIGTSSPDTRLQVVGADNDGSTATLKVTSGSQSMLLDGNEIDVISDNLYLQNNSASDVVLVNGGGNVGIGTAAPEYPLHIKNVGTTGPTIGMVIESSTSNRPVILFSEVTSDHGLEDGMSLEYDGTGGGTGNKFYINKVGGEPAVTVESSGEVGINTIEPGAPLHVLQTTASSNGLRIEHSTNTKYWDLGLSSFNLNFFYSGVFKASIDDVNGSYFSVSDARLKQDIMHMAPVLDKVQALRPSIYRYKSHPSAQKSIGFIAQEVAAIFPEVVKEEQGTKMINYDAFSVIAIQAIKELTDKNDLQEATIQQLEEKNNILESRLARIEKLLRVKAVESN